MISNSVETDNIMLYSVCMRNGPVGDEMNWESEQECEIRDIQC